MQPHVGFIGLGVMGRGMALNILKAGFPLSVSDIDRSALDKLMAAGARSVDSPRQLAGECDWIILSLPNTAVVERVLFGEEGLAPCLSEGRIVIDCGTTNPLDTMEFHKRLNALGVGYLDAPVSGMEQRALEGTLTTMVGGKKDVLDTVLPVLESMSSKVVYMGGPGCGQIAKVINNVFFNVACATVAELLPLAVKMGLDPEKVIEVAGSGTGQSFALNFFGPLILERNFGPGYAMESAYKDMASIIEIMKVHRIPIPVTEAAVSTYQMALNRGLGGENKGAMVKVWEDVLGVEVKKTGEK